MKVWIHFLTQLKLQINNKKTVYIYIKYKCTKQSEFDSHWWFQLHPSSNYKKSTLLVTMNETISYILLIPRLIPYVVTILNDIIIPKSVSIFRNSQAYHYIRVSTYLQNIICLHHDLNEEIIIIYGNQWTHLSFFTTHKFESIWYINCNLKRLFKNKGIFTKTIQENFKWNFESHGRVQLYPSYISKNIISANQRTYLGSFINSIAHSIWITHCKDYYYSYMSVFIKKSTSLPSYQSLPITA